MEQHKGGIIIPIVTSLDVSRQTYINPIIESAHCADDIIDLLLNRGTGILYERYLAKKNPHYNAGFYTKALEGTVIQEVRAYDPGETIDSYLINWVDEDEPETNTLDSWCPTAVKVLQNNHASSKQGTLESLSSLGESMQSRSHSRKRLSQKRLTTAPQSLKKLGGKEDVKTKRDIPQLEEEEIKFYKIPGADIYESDDEESASLRKEREDQRRQKTIEAQENKKKIQEEKERDEKKKKLEYTLKNKEYTFDFEGKPLFLTRVVQVNKLQNKDSVLADFNLENTLKVVKCLPDEPPVRENKKEVKVDKKGGVTFAKNQHDPTKSIDKMNTQDLFLPIAADLNEILEVRPGVKVEINEQIREGPAYVDPNKMKRADYLKSLEDRKKDRLGQYKKHMEQNELNLVISEGDEHPELARKLILESQLKRLGDLSKLTEVEIHEQEIFIQMLLEDAIADPRLALEEIKRREKVLKKLEKMKEEEREAKRADIIENRITNYYKQFAELPPPEAPTKGIAEKPATVKTPEKPSKIQKAFDAYNRQLILEEWDKAKQVINKPTNTPQKVPKVSPNKRNMMKAAVFDHHILKEPRERVTVSQKKAMELQTPVYSNIGVAKNETMKEKTNTIISSPPARVSTAKSNVTKHKMEEAMKEKVDQSKANENNLQGKAKVVVRNTNLNYDKAAPVSKSRPSSSRTGEANGKK